MEARQRVKLSLTNSSFGLITLISPCSSFKSALRAFEKISCLRSRAFAPYGAALRGGAKQLAARGRACEASLRRVPKARIKPSIDQFSRKPRLSKSNGFGNAKRPSRLMARPVWRFGSKSRSTVRTNNKTSFYYYLPFAGLVALAGSPHPIPSRTRP